MRKYKIALLMFMMLSTVEGYMYTGNDERHIMVAMRTIGHEVLLSSGDSVSLIPPIEKVIDRYRIRFEASFQFYPEQLAATVERVMNMAGIGSHYIVEVEKPDSGEVVYSCEIGKPSEELIPCGTRMQPKAFYTLYITILDPRTTSDMGNHYLIPCVLIVLLSGLIGLFAFFRREQLSFNSIPTIQCEDSNIVSIGDYQFDKINMFLTCGDEKIELSGKEAQLLCVLCSNQNKTIERDLILKMVWGDEGSYVGRTLDVFISKLRKKLEGESKVKIVNVRGIGYKMVVN